MLYQKKNSSSIVIDLSPLIDVVFLLLIFFMVSTTFKDSHGMDLNLPKASSETQSDSEQITVIVDRNGRLRVGDQDVNDAELAGTLSALINDSEEKMVILKIDETVDHGRVVEIMDTAKSVGATGITFAAKGKPSTQSQGDN